MMDIVPEITNFLRHFHLGDKNVGTVCVGGSPRTAG